MDLYTLLGVTRAATAGEIERAYRHLARRYHPGINPGDRVAEEMFRQIQRAYDVLVDLEQRREYDRGAQASAPAALEATVSFEGFDFSAPAEGPLAATFAELFADVFQDAAREAIDAERGRAVEVTLRLSFEDARARRTVSAVRRSARAMRDVRRRRARAAAVVCLSRRAAAAATRRWARGHMVFTQAVRRLRGQRADHESARAARAPGRRGAAQRSRDGHRAAGDRVTAPGWPCPAAARPARAAGRRAIST